jgi:hypothetical protein
MRAMVTMGHGDLDRIVLHPDWPRPDPASGEVLIKVGACGLNNTDVNTRTGWYSKAVSEATTGGAYEQVAKTTRHGAARPSPFRASRVRMSAGASWRSGTVWTPPASASASSPTTGCATRTIRSTRTRPAISARARRRLCRIHHDPGAECARHRQPAFRCGTGDLLLLLFHRRGHADPRGRDRADTVLVPGASGGVGGALVQLAKRRGARVIAMASEAKHGDVAALGPDRLLPRAPEDLRAAWRRKITVVADVVGGPYLAHAHRHPRTRRALYLFGRHCRADGHARPAHLLPARPDLHRLHRDRPRR